MLSQEGFLFPSTEEITEDEQLHDRVTEGPASAHRYDWYLLVCVRRNKRRNSRTLQKDLHWANHVHHSDLMQVTCAPTNMQVFFRMFCLLVFFVLFSVGHV